MTGRFETIYNCRPKGFDERPMWSVGRACSADHRQRESCPFHDLRASGCFQPEYGYGTSGELMAPADFFARKGDGHRFVVNTGTGKSAGGCGGAPIPYDTDPGRPSLFMLRPYDARPWTSTKKTTDNFSRPPYKAVPPPIVVPPPVEPIFRTSKNVGKSYLAYPHMPDEFKKRVTCERPAFRLKAGRVPFRLDPRLRFEPGPDVKDAKKPKTSIRRNVFVAHKPIQGTFTEYPHHIPTPYLDPSDGRPRKDTFFGGYSAACKRTAPIMVPWCTEISPAVAPTQQFRQTLRSASGL